jgi:hypothetical protein
MLKSNGVICKGFIDGFKVGENIYTMKEACTYDYIFVDSPNHWIEIARNFDQKKVVLCNIDGSDYIFYDDYIAKIGLQDQNKYDVLFLAYNRSNVIDASIVSRTLKEQGYRSAIIDLDDDILQNVKVGLRENSDIERVLYKHVGLLEYKAVVCAIDWESKYARPLIKKAKEKGIVTIGMVDGIEDFEDSDYNVDRTAYQIVEYVLAVGRNDLKFLQNKLNKCFVIGLPKMYHLYNELLTIPSKDRVMINLNFTYGTFVEERDRWLGEILEACKRVGIEYIISQHHADHGDLTGLHVSKDDVYETMRQSTIVISRFSTVLSEALALGKRVIYHNPHGETVKLYKEPMDAYSMSNDVNSLIEALEYERSFQGDQRKRAANFLDEQFNIKALTPPAKLATEHIIRLITKE